MIDLYFSYRSPYSYLILPRMLKLKNEHNVEINFKIVYPLAIRMPEWFKNKNIFFFIPFIRDFSKKAKKLNIPLKMPIKPDPRKQNTLTGKVSSHQPYIFDICHMGQFMCNKGKGIEFAYKLSTLIWSVKNWNKIAKLKSFPKNIPSAPNFSYKNKGWINWGDFLGTKFVSKQLRKYASFKDAQKYAKPLKLKSSYEWFKHIKRINKLPSNIPTSPHRQYKDKGWKGWPDFLGRKK